jgi:hypothetical protein
MYNVQHADMNKSTNAPQQIQEESGAQQEVSGPKEVMTPEMETHSPLKQKTHHHSIHLVPPVQHLLPPSYSTWEVSKEATQ